MRVGSLRSLGVCCCVYIAAAAVAFPTDFATVAWQFALILAVALPLVVVAIAGVVGFMESPTAPLSGARRRLGDKPRQAAKIVFIFLMGVAAYCTFKTNIPRLVPYYADSYLAACDEVLHGGAPWRPLHVLPHGLISPVVNFFYSIVWFGQWFGILLFVAMWTGRGRKRYLWALAFTMLVVGTLMAPLFSSVGPIFYDRFYGGNRFADLSTALQSDGGLRTVALFADYLLSSHENHLSGFGTGISAMPSMHVAIATLNALFLGSLNRKLGLAAWVFVAIIQFGSVYTGWHYAVDGYVSMAVVWAIWRLTGSLVLRTGPAAGAARPAIAKPRPARRPKTAPASP